eukprot:TRINITY_DN74971_c0_g1_i1.p1 TRINITY_DN74971_c0_g1~~TRINITY_DN74971_c0_g1_i1.p1  ORF type:complete len:508 (+),score=61.56 TRINITY_DN74971_c0_g1_i1:43-1566(+)
MPPGAINSGGIDCGAAARARRFLSHIVAAHAFFRATTASVGSAAVPPIHNDTAVVTLTLPGRSLVDRSAVPTAQGIAVVDGISADAVVRRHHRKKDNVHKRVSRQASSLAVSSSVPVFAAVLAHTGSGSRLMRRETNREQHQRLGVTMDISENVTKNVIKRVTKNATKNVTSNVTQNVTRNVTKRSSLPSPMVGRSPDRLEYVGCFRRSDHDLMTYHDQYELDRLRLSECAEKALNNTRKVFALKEPFNKTARCVLEGFDTASQNAVPDEECEEQTVLGQRLGGTSGLAVYAFLPVPEKSAWGNFACAPGWTSLGGRCTRFFSRPASWEGAERICALHGGHLASVHDVNEKAVIRRSSAFPSWVGHNCPNKPPFGICGVSLKVETWEWTDGANLSFLHSPVGLQKQDMKMGYTCGAISLGAGSQTDRLVARNCSELRPYTCARQIACKGSLQMHRTRGCGALNKTACRTNYACEQKPPYSCYDCVWNLSQDTTLCSKAWTPCEIDLS